MIILFLRRIWIPCLQPRPPHKLQFYLVQDREFTSEKTMATGGNLAMEPSVIGLQTLWTRRGRIMKDTTGFWSIGKPLEVSMFARRVKRWVSADSQSTVPFLPIPHTATLEITTSNVLTEFSEALMCCWRLLKLKVLMSEVNGPEPHLQNPSRNIIPKLCQILLVWQLPCGNQISWCIRTSGHASTHGLTLSQLDEQQKFTSNNLI